MEVTTKKSHKEWRRLAKKERRRRIRQRAAAERDADAERLRAALESTAEYLSWVELQEQEEKEKELKEKEEHNRREKLWLEEEARAQKEWQIIQERKLKARQQQLEQEAKIRQEFEAKQEAIRKKQEEDKLKQEEDLKKREQLLKEINDYIDNGIKTPEALRKVVDSQPGKEVCPFFSKTGACRYGNMCSRNHQRVCLSKVILIPGFYTHFALEKNSAEYDTDITLEFESSETRQHFYEFYKDVLPELESYGRIKTLKYCCNTEVHLRGNLYVEYYTEREAARAVRSLKGRWYAGRQLNCEFCNLKSWRSAVCGTSKCPKGRACNFLHTFRNPHDEYDIKSPPRWAKQPGNQETGSRRTEYRSKSKWEEDTTEEAEDRKNWRWSESPEPESSVHSKHAKKRRRHSTDRSQSQKVLRDKAHNRSDRSRTPEHSTERHSSHSRKYHDDKLRDDEARNGHHTSRQGSSKSRRNKDCDNDYSESRRTHRSYSNGRRDRSSHSRSDRHHESSSRRNNHDGTDERRKSHKSTDSREFESSKNSNNKTSGKSISGLSLEKSTNRSKSKWDKEKYESSSSSSSSHSDESSNSDEEDRLKEKNSSKVRTRVTKETNDEWITTDSESEDNDQCPT